MSLVSLPNNEITTFNLIQPNSPGSQYLEKYQSVLNEVKQKVLNNNWTEVDSALATLDDFRFLIPSITSEHELNDAKNNSVFLIFLSEAFNLFCRYCGLNFDGLTLIVSDPARFYQNFILGGLHHICHQLITNILTLVKSLNLTAQYIALLYISMDVVQSFPQHIPPTISRKWLTSPRI